MKVLDLRCAHGHRFEGWFASEDDFLGQSERGLVGCPVCEDKQVTRLPSAPRLNVSSLRQAEPTAAVPDTAEHAHARWMQMVNAVLQNTEDVGDRFPEEARRIHYGEAKDRGIRGHATAEDADALREEGIEVVSLPIPKALKGPVQ